MDYLVAVAVALIGIVIMYFIFNSISNADVHIVSAETTSTRQPRSKKPRKTSRNNKEDALDLETEALIARELARNPSGMSRDSRTVQPETLDEVRSRNQVRHAPKATSSEEVSARQRLIDRELGFQTVEKPSKPSKAERAEKAAEKANAAAVTDAADEEMERKLSAFFQNARRGRLNAGNFGLEEEPAATGTTGGRVTVKRSITNTKSW